MKALKDSSSMEHRRLKSDAPVSAPVNQPEVFYPESAVSRITASRPLSERLKQFLEQLDLSLRRIDAGLM